MPVISSQFVCEERKTEESPEFPNEELKELDNEGSSGLSSKSKE
jgi:hypothetical protein